MRKPRCYPVLTTTARLNYSLFELLFIWTAAHVVQGRTYRFFKGAKFQELEA